MKYCLVIVVFLSDSCVLDPFHRGINSKIQPHVDKFFEEAQARGLGFDRCNLTVQFGKSIGGAQGKTITPIKTILIDSDSPGWRYNPEALVFHELGHLFLKRGHQNATINKFCISIMSSQDDPVYDCSETDNLYNRRKYYIDELFNPSTETPEWMTK